MNNEPITPAAEKLESLMGMMDLMKKAQAGAKRLEQTKFEDVSRSTWGEVVLQMQFLQLICDTMIDMVPFAAKIVSNEALSAHIEAVKTAD
jgi:hypothetical protein